MERTLAGNQEDPLAGAFSRPDGGMELELTQETYSEPPIAYRHPRQGSPCHQEIVDGGDQVFLELLGFFQGEIELGDNGFNFFVIQ